MNELNWKLFTPEEIEEFRDKWFPYIKEKGALLE